MPATAKTISGADSWTDPVHIIGEFNFSIVASTSPAFSGTVTVQRSSDGTVWRDVDTWDSVSAEEVGYDPMKNYYRAGIKAGDYSAGSALLSINGYDTWPPRF
jgi:hypothetical protein